MFTAKNPAAPLIVTFILSLGMLNASYAGANLSAKTALHHTRQASHDYTTEDGPRILKPGDSIDRDLAGGGRDSYLLELPARQFLQVVVEQDGIDVVLTISQVNGSELTKVDRPNSSRGRETASVITPKAGSYLLQISSLEAITAKGRYHLHVNQLREPTTKDTTWIAAEKTVSEGERLRSQSSADSFRKAIEAFKKAEELWHTLKQPYEQAVALFGIGITCTSLSDNQSAIEFLSHALHLFDHDTHGKAITTAAMGWPYMYLGADEKALESFSQAFQLYHSQANARGEGITLYGIGWVHALRGEDREAMANFSKSLHRRREAKDRRGEAITLAGIGKIEARLGNYPRALDSLKQAREVLAGRDRYAEADILSNLGWVYNALGDEASALDYFQRALILRQQVGDRIGEVTTFYGISRTQRRLGHLQEALSAIEGAVNIIEALRAGGLNHQLRISYFSSIQDYYHFYIGLLMHLHRLEPSHGYAAKALHANERARARGLIDLLAEAQIDLREGTDPSLLDQERTADEKLNAAAARRNQILGGGHTQEEIQRASQEARELASQYDAIEARIRAANPRYAAITHPEPLTAVEMQRQLLDDDTLLLEYSLSDEGSYLWMVTRHGLSSYELPEREKVESLARDTYEQLTARDQVVAGESVEAKRARVARADASASQGLRALSEILLVPVAERLGKNRLVIVVQGVLQLIPFAALPIPAAALDSRSRPASAKRFEAVPANAPPLIFEHEVVMLPSATTLAVLRKATKTRTAPVKTVAVLADPVYSARDARLQASLKNGRSALHRHTEKLLNEGNAINGESRFSRLLSSLWEAKMIVSLVPANESKLFLDFAANRAVGMSKELRNYRLVHFAAHALIDDEHPELSGIVLSTVDEKGRPRDGFLRSNAIFNLKLSADLVVLSACRSGLGKDFKGEGLVGLTRGFMYAGAQRVLVSLWDVDDKPTSELMVRFYQRMLGPEKRSPAAALRSAQLELSQDPRWQAPYFWAPFVLQGEW
jgi:CHAT domain-containing protein/tetratricopeptide (TPR) repeat protein